MKNYNEILAKVENFDEMEVIIGQINDDIVNNAEYSFTEKAVKNAVDGINADFEKQFLTNVIGKLDADRKTAFESLVKCPSFPKAVYSYNENGTIKLEKKTAVFKFANLEKKYQLDKSTETNKDGKPIANKAVTVFGALRFYGLCECFIRNIFIGNTTVDSEKTVDISKVKIDNEAIFVDDNGKTFVGGSNSALERQLNVLVKFFGLDVKMLKRDLPILKLSAQKIKRDNESNKSSINEVKVLKFVDVLFSVITSRYNNEDVKIFTADGNECKKADTENTTK